MSTLAVIGTFYRRPWAVPRIADAISASTRCIDEMWLMYEDPDDGAGLLRDWGEEARPIPVQIRPDSQNPLGVAINTALDLTHATYITYLTDDSLPRPDKYRLMARALDENPDWGAVYCSQDYGTVASPEEWLAAIGTTGSIRRAAEPEPSPFCRVDHTQVMHRRTAARWPLSYDDRKLSDAHFFRDLVDDLGPLMPVPEVLDWTRQLPDGLSRR